MSLQDDFRKMQEAALSPFITSLFSSESDLALLSEFEKTSGSKEDAERLRAAKRGPRLVGDRTGEVVMSSSDFRNDPLSVSALERFNLFTADRKARLEGLEKQNKARTTQGRNQTILTTDINKTILGGAS